MLGHMMDDDLIGRISVLKSLAPKNYRPCAWTSKFHNDSYQLQWDHQVRLFIYVFGQIITKSILAKVPQLFHQTYNCSLGVSFFYMMLHTTNCSYWGNFLTIDADLSGNIICNKRNLFSVPTLPGCIALIVIYFKASGKEARNSNMDSSQFDH